MNTPMSTATRVPEVHDAIESLGNLIGGLQETIERIERRLECVATPIGPTAPVESITPHAVPLVGRLSMLCCSLRQCDNRINDLYNRLAI